MPILELPHTAGCLVCGPHNPHSFGLSLHVDTGTGVVIVRFTPQLHHIGFAGIVHGGAIATVFDEAMVWAASWFGKRFCVCGEMSVRFRASSKVGLPIECRAKVELSRARLITTSAEAKDESGHIIATAAGKYIPVSAEENHALVATFLDSPITTPAARQMRGER